MSGLRLREQEECGTPTPYRPRCGRLAPKSPQQPEATMSVAQSVATILDEKVTLEIESIDRMYLNVYVPHLQTPAGVAHFFRQHRGATFAASALMEPMTSAFVAALERFARTQGIPLLTFKKGQRKDAVAAAYRAQFEDEEGVLFLGKAQEKATVCRTEKRRNPQTGRPYPWLARSTALVNQYYIYAVDRDFGPFFLKFCSYFPYNAKLCLNGHEYLKRQLLQEGIAFEALDNGLLSCAGPARAQALSDGLDAARIDALLRKWLHRLPHPFTPDDRAAGYRYDVSILQAEFARTQVLDRPVSGRILCEEIIRENLDLGRPDHVQLIFERRVTQRTPRRFRTRVLTQGVVPSLYVDYKNTRIKQYHKEGRALRTETTINDTRDFAKRHARLRHRQTAAQPARVAGGRLWGQSTSARRPNTQPRLPDRRGRFSAGHTAAGRGRPTCLRFAFRRSARAGSAERAGPVLSAAAGGCQPGYPLRSRSAAGAGSPRHDPGPHDLRPAPPALARVDRTHPAQPSLPCHARGATHRLVLHPGLRAHPAAGLGAHHPPRSTGRHRPASLFRQAGGGD